MGSLGREEIVPFPQTIDELMRNQAKANPDAPVLSYPSAGTDYVNYSLRQLDTFAYRVAQHYLHVFPQRRSSEERALPVALLALSNLDYIVTLLALSKLGHSVLLLSPRLTLPAYASLLQSTRSRHVVVQAASREKINGLKEEFPELVVEDIATQAEYGHPVTELGGTNMMSALNPAQENLQVAWIHHSSGSTGFPKPIFITQKAVLANYHRDQDRLGMQSFLTLPLFHTHGISSLFRAFITGKRIRIYNASLPLAQKHLINSMQEQDFDIFATVPYALKLLSEAEEGIEFLRKFKIVTFGGAPCPDPLGDFLTARGVVLVTVFGMGELGPVMTSWRPADDKDWAYLRPSPLATKYLSFEDRGEGLFELVCLEGWPSKVSSNRPDGSYATKDLFFKHPTLNAWKYSGRIDDVIVLEKGEKANPLPIEGAVRQSSLVSEAVVFGVGKPHFGLVVILSEAGASIPEEEVLDKLSPIIEEAQEELDSYSRISRDMVILLPVETEYPRTDKGTVIRKAFYKNFSQLIDDSYVDKMSATSREFSRSELKNFIRLEIRKILDFPETTHFDDDKDFFELGMESLQASQLRSILVKNINSKGQTPGLNIVFDYPSVNSLAKKIDSICAGSIYTTESVEDEMKALITKYSDFQPHIQQPRTYEGQFVVITGATGSLGAHILASIARQTDVKKIYCLARASNNKKAHSRVISSLRERKVYHTLNVADRRKIVCLAADLSLPSLGLPLEIYAQMAEHITTLYHCAWTVNFNLKLSSFEKDCIAGLKHLIDLCLKARGNAPAKLIFCSSVGTILRTKEAVVPESLHLDFSSTQPTGYARSKLIAEYICHHAVARAGVTAYTLRVGQIVGDTEHGVWNSSEAVPLMLQTARTIGTLPSIDESLRWLPVNKVAETIIEIANSEAPAGIFNLVNPHTFHWTRDLLPYLQKAGLKFEIQDPPSWLNLLRSSNNDPAVNPPVKLLEYLTSNYDSTSPRRAFDFQTDNTMRYSNVFANIMAPDEKLIRKILHYFTTSCWKTTADLSASPAPRRTVVICGTKPAEIDALVACLSSHLKLQMSKSSLSAAAGGTSIINAGTLNTEDREKVRGQVGTALFLLLQDETAIELDSGPTIEETDVVPLDTGAEYSDLLEDAVSCAQEFLG